MTALTLVSLRQGVEADDVAGVADLLARDGGGMGLLAADECSGGKHLLAAVRSTGMMDVFLSHGVTPQMVSGWWAPGFGLGQVSPAVAEHLIQRGATVTPHAAAAMGLIGRLRHMSEAQPELVDAKGGDGCRPLHFSRDVETARLLLELGADLDARDDDHNSTPAQWRIGDAPEVTRFLLERGAQPDLFMAAALDDAGLARRLIGEDPACLTFRIGHNRGPFPGIGFQGRGGTIYQWTLGFNQSPHEVAWHRGHRELFELLASQSSPRTRLLAACMLADRPSATGIMTANPGLVGELDGEDRGLLAKCCWETNLNREAVRLMLDLGFPVDAPEFNHGYLPLHNAAWCGDAELVELLLQRGHPLDRRDPGHHATALGFAIYSCVVAKRHPAGDFQRVVQLLVDAGIPLDGGQYPTGDAGIDAALQRKLQP